MVGEQGEREVVGNWLYVERKLEKKIEKGGAWVGAE